MAAFGMEPLPLACFSARGYENRSKSCAGALPAFTFQPSSHFFL